MTDSARLYLLSPVIDNPTDFRPVLEEALRSGLVDCVLLRRSAAVPRDKLAGLISLVGEHGAAALLEGEARDAARTGADGVHLRGLGAGVTEALETLKPEGIVGVGALSSRDDAMSVGELGVDYLMFGEPRPDGYVPSLLTTLEQARWWAEIFNVPCVAYADKLDDINPLAEAGVEFVALGDALWRDPRGPRITIESIAGLLMRDLVV